MTAVDLINVPPHYRQGAIECIDAIRSALTFEEYRGYCKGNCIKYVWRECHKNGAQDVAKLRWYSDELIKHLNSIEDNAI